MRAKLCCKALRNVLEGENCSMVIIQSDQGRQFISDAFQEAVREFGYSQSMGRTYCYYDNARMESFNATIKKERLSSIEIEKMSLLEVESEFFDYIHYYNHHRIALFNQGWPPLVYRDMFLML